MAENKDKKVLNVPNKRELTPNELGSRLFGTLILFFL